MLGFHGDPLSKVTSGSQHSWKENGKKKSFFLAFHLGVELCCQDVLKGHHEVFGVQHLIYDSCQTREFLQNKRSCSCFILSVEKVIAGL